MSKIGGQLIHVHCIVIYTTTLHSITYLKIKKKNSNLQTFSVSSVFKNSFQQKLLSLYDNRINKITFGKLLEMVWYLEITLNKLF